VPAAMLKLGTAEVRIARGEERTSWFR